MEIYAGPPAAYDEPYYYSPGYTVTGPRVYGYRRYYSDPAYDGDDRLPRRRGGCGTYHYWDGEQCVDARYK